jgi:hypothetical protein
MKLSDLKTHGKATQEHNFNTQKCKIRDFDHMKSNLAGQIRRLGEDDISVDTFSELVIKKERHDVERLFRERGKYHESIVGPVNAGVTSMQYSLAFSKYKIDVVVHISFKIKLHTKNQLLGCLEMLKL